MHAEQVVLEPLSKEHKDLPKQGDQKIAAMITRSRYQAPTVISFPLSGLGDAGQLSLIGTVD